jgi:hypothetical protein
MKAMMAVLAAAGLLLGGSRAAAQEMPKPGPEHAKLKEIEGTWDAHMKMRPAPGAPVMEGKGTYTTKMDLGGFWLIGDFQGEFQGQPFKGHGIDGYDQMKKKYTGYWVDSMASFGMNSEGNYQGKTLVMVGQAPNMEGKMTKYTMKSELKDKDTLVMEMYEGDGKEPMMTITYKRKK